MTSRVKAAHRHERKIIPYTLAAAIIFSCTSVCYGHGRLLDPPSRATMWRLGFDSPADYDDHQGYCGGKDSLWRRFRGLCGVCGDPYYPVPRAHERGGRYYTGTPTKTYRSGSWITATVAITANHRGWLEFRLCAYDDPKEGDLEYDSDDNFVEVTQRCLNRHVLTLANGETRFYLPEPYSSGEYDVRVRLPRGVVCRKCLFQWKWNVGNSWGTDPDGESCVGCGEQEQFYACADIVIKPRDGAGRSKHRGSRGHRRRQKVNRKGQGDRGSRQQDNKHRSRLSSKKVEDGRIENTATTTVPRTISVTTTTVPRTTSVTTTKKTIVEEPHWWFVQHVPLIFHNTEKGETSTETTVGTFHPRYAVATASTASTSTRDTRTSENISTKLWATIPTINIADNTSKKQDVPPSFWKWVSSFSPLLTKSVSSLRNEHNLSSLSVEKEPEKVPNLDTVRQDLTPHVNSSSQSPLVDPIPEAEIFHSWWRRLSSKLSTVFLQGLFGDTESSSRAAKDIAITNSLRTDSNYIKHRSRRNGEVARSDEHYFKSVPDHGERLNTTFAATADGLTSVGHENNHSFRSLYDRSNSKLNTLLGVNADVNSSHIEQQFTAADLNGTDIVVDSSLQRNLNTSTPELIDRSRFESAQSLTTQQTKGTLRKRFAENSVGTFNARTKAKLVVHDFPTFSGSTSTITTTETNIIDSRNRAVQVQTTVNPSLPSTSTATDTAGITQHTETPTTVSHSDRFYPTDDFSDQLPYDDFSDRRKNSTTSHLLKVSQTASRGGMLHVNSPSGELKQKQKLDITSETGTTNSSAEESGILVLTLERRIELPLERHWHPGLSESKLHHFDSYFNSSKGEQGNSRFLSVSTFATPVTSPSSLTTAHHSWRNSMDSGLSNHRTDAGVNADNFHNKILGAAKDNQENTSSLYTTNSQTNNSFMISNALQRNDTSRILNRTLTQDNVNNDSLSKSQNNNAYFTSTPLNMKTEIWRNKNITERERPLHSRADNETIGDEHTTDVNTPTDHDPVTDNIRNEPTASLHNITLANIDMFVDAGDTNTEVYSKPQQTHLPQRSPYEKRLLLHDRIAHLLTSLKDATSVLDSNSPFVNTPKNSFAAENLVTERTHIHGSLQFDASRHETGEDKESGRAAKGDYLGGNSVSEKDAGGHGELDPVVVPGSSRSVSDGDGRDTVGGTAGHTGGHGGHGNTEAGLNQGGHGNTEAGLNQGKNGRLDWGWSESDESKYVNSEDTDGPVSGKLGENGDNNKVRGKIRASFDMPTLQIALGGNTESHVALSSQKTGTEIPSRVFNAVSDREDGHTGLANSYVSRHDDHRESRRGDVEGSGFFMEGKAAKRQHHKENNGAFGESQEQSHYNRHGLGEKWREVYNAEKASDPDDQEFEVAGVQGNTEEAKLGNGRLEREWEFHSGKRFSSKHTRDGQTLSHAEEPRSSQLVANNNIMEVDRNMFVGITYKEEETRYKRNHQKDNVQDQDNSKYENRKMDNNNIADEESNTIYLSYGGDNNTADSNMKVGHSNRVKRSSKENKENEHECKLKEDAHEHNKGGHEGGELKEDGHEGGEHKDDGHEGGEHKDSGHEGGEHKEGGHEGGEHKEGGYEGGELKEGGHEGGEHKDDGHEGDEHKEGGHEGGENKEGGHEGGELKEGGHEGGEHKEVGHEGGEHKEGGHEGGERVNGGEHEENKHVEDVHEGSEHEGSDHEEHHNVGEHIEHEHLEDEHQEAWHEHKKCGDKGSDQGTASETVHEESKHVCEECDDHHSEHVHDSDQGKASETVHEQHGHDDCEEEEHEGDSGEEHEIHNGKDSECDHEDESHDSISHKEDKLGGDKTGDKIVSDEEKEGESHGSEDHHEVHEECGHQVGEHGGDEDTYTVNGKIREKDDNQHHEGDNYHHHKQDDKHHLEKNDHHEVHEECDHEVEEPGSDEENHTTKEKIHESNGHHDHEMDDQHHEMDDQQHHEENHTTNEKIHESNDHHDHEMDDQHHEMDNQHHHEENHTTNEKIHESANHHDHEMDDHCHENVDHNHHVEDDHQGHEMDDQHHHEEGDHHDHETDDQHPHVEDDQHHHVEDDHQDHEMDDQHHHGDCDHQDHEMDDQHHHEEGDHHDHETDDQHHHVEDDQHHNLEDDHQDHDMDDQHHHGDCDHQDHEMDDQHHHEEGEHHDHETDDQHHHEEGDHHDHGMDDQHHHDEGDHHDHEMDDQHHHDEGDHHDHKTDDQHHHGDCDQQDHVMDDQHHHEEGVHHDHEMDDQHHHEEGDHHDHEMYDQHHHGDCDHQDHEIDDQHHHEEGDYHDHETDDQHHHEEGDHHDHEMDDQHHHEEGDHHDREMDDQHHHGDCDHHDHEIDYQHHHEEGDHHDHETDDQHHHEEGDHHDHEMDDHHHHGDCDHQVHETDDQHHHEEGDHHDHEMDDQHHHEEGDHHDHETDDQNHHGDCDHQDHEVDDQHHHEEGDNHDHETDDHHLEEDDLRGHVMDEHHHHEVDGHQHHEKGGQNEQDEVDHSDVHEGCKNSEIKTASGSKGETSEKIHKDNIHETFDDSSNEHGQKHHEHEESSNSETKHDECGDVEIGHDEGSHKSTDVDHREKEKSLKENETEEDEQASESDFGDYFSDNKESNQGDSNGGTSGSEINGKKQENTNPHGGKESDWEFHNAQTYGLFGHGGK